MNKDFNRNGFYKNQLLPAPHLLFLTNWSLGCAKKLAPDPMKAIDWKAVNRDKTLSSEYTVNVFNRFQELSHYDSESTRLDSRNIHLIYGNLVAANEEVALPTLPKNQNHKEIELLQT